MGLESESSCEETEFKIEIIDEETKFKTEISDEQFMEMALVDDEDDESSGKQEEKTHICTYRGCNKKFSRPSKLQAHLCYHTGERAFKCKHEGCNKSYSRPQHLRRHVVTTHNKTKCKKLLRCSYPGCMKELSNQQNLKKHYYRKHERIYPFTCKFCDKGFPKHQQLTQHLYQHTGIPPFKCTECDIGFTKVGDLNRHNRGHKTYTCTFPDCGVTLKAWTHMRTHMKLKHPSEFACEDCERTFRTKSRLKIHASIHKEPHEREIFPCTYTNCPRFYFKKSNLTQHIRSSHEGKKFQCTYDDCDRALHSKKKLEEHLKLHRTNRPTPRRKKPKNKRSDTGKHKRSMAVKLSGVNIPYYAEKMLLNCDSGTNDSLRELCALTHKAALDSAGNCMESPAAGQLGCAKQKEIRRMSVLGDMSIRNWLQLMMEAMEEMFPSLKQIIE